MKFNIEIAKILDNHLPANGVGTEREKLRMGLMADLLMVVNKLPIHSVSNQRELLIDGFIETIEKEFSDQNWTYLEYVKERYLGNL